MKVKIYIYDSFSGMETRRTLQSLREEWDQRKHEFEQTNFIDWCDYIGLIRK